MSGPGSLPPAPPSAPIQAQPVRDGTPARILDASGILAQLARPITVTGQVVSLDPSGAVRIHTDQGDVTLQLRNQTVPVITGQTVEIDLSAGRPPRQAIVRPSDAAPSAPPQSATPQGQGVIASTPSGGSGDGAGGNNAESAALGTNTASAGRPAGPLLTDTTITELADTARTALPPAPPQEVTIKTGDLVRLLPLAAGTPLLPPAETVVPISSALASMVTTLPKTLPAETGDLHLVITPVVAGSGKTIPNSLSSKVTLPLLGAPPPLRAPPGLLAQAREAATPPLPLLAKLPLIPLAAQIGKLPLVTSAPQLPLVTSLSQGAVKSLAPAAPAVPIDIRLGTMQLAAIRFIKTTNPSTTPAIGTRPAQSLLESAPHALTGVIVGRIVQQGFAPLPVLSVTLPGQTTPQLFAVQVAASNLPVGTLASFTPQLANTVPDDMEPVAGPLLLPATQWTTMSVLHDAAAALLPHAASPLTVLLPNPAVPAALPAAALLFVAALRSGDLAGWLGAHLNEALRQAGQGGTIDRLAAEGAILARADAPAPDGWRTLPLPLLYQGEVQRAILHYRHDRAAGKEENGKRRRNTRFVFDMALNRFGPVQLDGLHQPKMADADDDRLDLIVRTQENLSAPMQAAMRVRYHTALDACDHRGEMVFQRRREQWLNFATG